MQDRSASARQDPHATLDHGGGAATLKTRQWDKQPVVIYSSIRGRGSTFASCLNPLVKALNAQRFSVFAFKTVNNLSTIEPWSKEGRTCAHSSTSALYTSVDKPLDFAMMAQKYYQGPTFTYSICPCTARNVRKVDIAKIEAAVREA